MTKTHYLADSELSAPFPSLSLLIFSADNLSVVKLNKTLTGLKQWKKA